jgi:hypothetical protein
LRENLTLCQLHGGNKKASAAFNDAQAKLPVKSYKPERLKIFDFELVVIFLV